jgi:hypothetical protein
MKSLSARTVNELKNHLAGFGDDYLFRGQTRHHVAEDSSPLLNSSFARQGCVPPLMLKWIFYVDELLRRGGFDIKRPDASDITQGLLQHYGWRSFFVDLSASAAVASWFASHAFTSARGMDFCEDSWEEPVMLVVLRASYSDFDGEGSLYVLSKAALQAAGHKVISLVDDLPTEGRTRFLVLKAWLASIFGLQTRLDPKAIVARIGAPGEVFRELAASEGLTVTDEVFPGPDQDGILSHFLSLPRMMLDMPDPMFRTYLRSIEIPEYQDSFVKHLPTSTVLAEEFWPSDAVEAVRDGLCFRVPEEIFYGVVDVGPMPNLIPYLAQNAVTHIETEKLICLPVSSRSNTYEKGISIRRAESGLYEIGSLGVDYQSDKIIGVGVARGHFYGIAQDSLVRVETAEDCPCGDPQKHFYHLRACAVLNDLLGMRRHERKGNIVSVSI